MEHHTQWGTIPRAAVYQQCRGSRYQSVDTHQALSGEKKLIFSPDTDVYHIGLTNINCSFSDIYVLLSERSSYVTTFEQAHRFPGIRLGT